MLAADARYTLLDNCADRDAGVPGKVCVRGWGCAHDSVVFVTVGAGTAAFAGIVFCFGAVVYWQGKKHGVTRTVVQWVFIVCFPLWAAWFIWSGVQLVGLKTPGFRKYAPLLRLMMAVMRWLVHSLCLCDSCSCCPLCC